MYVESLYAPKINKNQLGDNISTRHGATQERASSTNLFSFYVSDMGSALNDVDSNDFLDPYNLIQLADDTILLAEYFESLHRKFAAIFKYSKDKYQIPNVKKTFYPNFSKRPTMIPMSFGETSIDSIDKDKCHVYLGMSFLPTDNFHKILMFNINNRMKHITKYYAWLEITENTPIETKLLVLDNCAMSALVYGCEAWGGLSCVKTKLVSAEKKVLKRILNVKSGTSNDLIFYELKRSNIISQIKDRQYNRFQKLQSFSDDDAVTVDVMQLCKRSSVMDYYYNLNGNNCLNFLSALEEKIRNVDMIPYYRNLIHVEKSCIYTSFLNDYYRKIITRWRLSCHKLKIETGRYARPFIPREERICETCNTIDDEHHAIFICPVYHNARQNFIHLLSIILLKTF